MAATSDAQVVTAEELAALLRVHPNTVYRRVREGVFPIPPLKSLGRHLRFSRVLVERYLADELEVA